MLVLSPIRKTLVGFHDDHDRLWVLHIPNLSPGKFAITDYNWELTGFSKELSQFDPKVFHYGGNAYYITGMYAHQKGWRVEHVEDRW